MHQFNPGDVVWCAAVPWSDWWDLFSERRPQRAVVLGRTGDRSQFLSLRFDVGRTGDVLPAPVRMWAADGTPFVTRWVFPTEDEAAADMAKWVGADFVPPGYLEPNDPAPETTP